MGFRFSKSVKLMPGVRLNFSKSGISTTVGARGASVNLGKRGAFMNLGLPGTGLSYREKISGSSSPALSSSGPLPTTTLPQTKLSSYFYFLVTCFFGVPFLYLFYKGYKRYTATIKPVYGMKPIYKADKRFKSGARQVGNSLVITGYEPLTAEEIAASKSMATTRFIIGGILLVLCIAAYGWAAANNPG